MNPMIPSRITSFCICRSKSRRRASQPTTQRKRTQSAKRTRSNKYEKWVTKLISPITTYSSNDIFLRDFVEGSSESEDTSFSEPSEISSDSSIDEERPKPKVQVKKSPLIVQTKSFSVTHVPIRKKIVKKDRFYDKSRDIPNDVYFGDVKGDETVLRRKLSYLSHLLSPFSSSSRTSYTMGLRSRVFRQRLCCFILKAWKQQV